MVAAGIKVLDATLHGPRGAAQIFGPQKGATPTQVEHLDRGLEVLGDVEAQTPQADGLPDGRG